MQALNPERPRNFFIMALLLALMSIAPFLPGLSGGFVLDDITNIGRNYILHVKHFDTEELILAALSFHDRIGTRALPMLSFALDHLRAGGLDPGAFKVTNLIIHALTTFVLVFLARRLLQLAGWLPRAAAWGGLAIALCWAIHPLQVSSVLYVVQRMQTMATLFIFLALWSYLLARQVQIAGGRGRGLGLLMLLFWFAALMCKEDALLLPLYTLALELTFLRFAAEQAVVAKGLRQIYGLFIALAVLLYVFYVIPHYWSWEPWPTRNFSASERLLTQARVLVMYLGQILVPWPDHLPFIYDTYPVSRSLWQPWTTLPALLILLGLITWAWLWRHKRPLFSFGVLLFFSGHFMTSNVIPLELVFEHRNHLPLLGVLLALADLLAMLWSRLPKQSVRFAILIYAGLAGLLGIGTLAHAYTWGDTVRHTQKMVALSPESPRAWAQLGASYYDRYKVDKNPDWLRKGIAANLAGLEHLSSITLAMNVVIYKAVLGESDEADWQRLYRELKKEPSGRRQREAASLLLENIRRGVALDKERIVPALDMVPMTAQGYLESGYFIYTTEQKDKALSYFKKAVTRLDATDANISNLFQTLTEEGLIDWVEQLRVVQSGAGNAHDQSGN